MYNKIGILAAVEKESEPYFNALQCEKTTSKGVWTVHEGKLCGVNVAVLHGGICRASISAATQMLIDNFDVDAVLFSGSAGCICKGPRIGDTIVVTEAEFHDVPLDSVAPFFPYIRSICFAADEELLKLAHKAAERALSQKIWFGKTVTGDIFIDKDGRGELIKKYNPMCADMETAAAAQICMLNGKPFLCVRSVSDTEEESGISSFEKNLERAAQSSFAMTAQLLKEMAN